MKHRSNFFLKCLSFITSSLSQFEMILIPIFKGQMEHGHNHVLPLSNGVCVSSHSVSFGCLGAKGLALGTTWLLPFKFTAVTNMLFFVCEYTV